MIDAYLKTSMPVYDSLDRQNHRDECCKNEQFKLYTDRNHLPPFQLFIPDYNGINQTMISFQIFDIDDVEIIGSPAMTNLDDRLEFYDDGTNNWIVYNGLALAGDFAIGQYYIRIIITIGVTILDYYTELFTVCDCDLVLADCDREKSIFYDTQERGYPGGVVVHDSTVAPQIYYYNNKSYCVWMQRGSVPWDCEAMVYAIYHESCYISESYGVREGTVGGRDPHAYPAVIVADDGYIIIAHERLTGVGFPNAHNGFMQIKRSDNPEDETSWVNAIAHNASHFQELGNEGAWRLTYPHFDKLPDGTIYLTCRHSSVAELDRIVIFRSDDNGRTWDALGGDIDGGCDICDLNLGPSGDECYVEFAKHGNDDTLHVIVSWKSVAGANPPYGLDIYYIKSTDNAVNWQSVDGAHSQDITFGGNNPITKVNLDILANHYLVRNVASPSDAQPRPAVVCDSGIPYIIIGEGIRPAGNYNQYVYYWTGAVWNGINTGINPNSACIPSAHIFLRPNTTEECNCYEFLTITEIDSVIKWRIYRSFDLITWEMIYEFDTVDLDSLCVPNATASYTFNYTETDCEAMQHVVNTNVNWYDFYINYKCADAFTMCNHLSLVWWHECDFDGIIYQFGYRNRLILDAVLESPRVEIEKSTKKRIGTLFSEWISHKEFYGIKLMLSKYAFYALSRLPLYADNEFGHVILTLPNGDWAEIYEMTIDATWQTDNCYAEFMLDFIQDELVITNCCEDYDVSEQVSE